MGDSTGQTTDRFEALRLAQLLLEVSALRDIAADRLDAEPPQLKNGGAMKAIVHKRYGAPERVLRLEEIDRPPVGDYDVLIRVRASSVNTPDWITVTGVPTSSG